MRRRTSRGFTLIELMIVIAIIAIIAAIAIPNLIQARKHGNETAAIGALKTIATSQSIFREGDKEGDGSLDYATLADLSQTQLVDGVLGTGTKQGYLFAAGKSSTTGEFLWFAEAHPVVPTTTGDRYFCTNQAGVIFYTTRGSFSINSSDCSTPATALPVGK
jgi:type IV pilus assembly protein PilA